MLKARVIPCLLLKGNTLVKTVRFKKYDYIGDPLNTCRIFNELEVDEMTILDISASKEHRGPNYKVLESLVSECFMPLSYGGGITRLEEAHRLFYTGFEKVVLNSITFQRPQLITEIANIYGNQSIIASIDIKKDMFGKYCVYSLSGTKKEKVNLVDWVKSAEGSGAGEILLTNIDREGTWAGFDLDIISKISSIVEIPIIIHGGAGSVEDINNAIKAGASAVGVGSIVVFQKKNQGVLINFPDKSKLDLSLNV